MPIPLKPILTGRLELVPQTLHQVRAHIESMDDAQKSQLSQDWLARVRAGSADVWALGFVLVDRASRILIGQCGYKEPPGEDRTVEIAYGIAPEHQGRGYATEAAAALVEYAFSSGEVRNVRAHTLPEPNASTRVLAKCGFHRTGEVVDPEDGRVWRWERSGGLSGVNL